MTEYGLGWWISPSGKFYNTTRDDHVRMILFHPERFGFTKADVAGAELHVLEDIAIRRGWIRYRYFSGSNNFQVGRVDVSLRLIETALVRARADTDDRVMISEIDPEVLLKDESERVYAGTVADVYDKTILERVERNPPSTLRVKLAGKVPYDQLDDDTRYELPEVIARSTEEDPAEVLAGLSNGAVLPVVEVDPKQLLKAYRGYRTVSRAVVREYKRAWLAGGATFPAIIINTSDIENLIEEGGHRTTSAAEAGVRLIRAVDVAGARVVKTPEGLETYDLLRARLGR